ncbi:MFS transporter [Desulfohalovibrio reitneri]|uniref:MFS transporter n=1 Tax=Desulfohalovibrio reitneri TaxID=1307759 RepID=UPI0009DEDA1A|nr:MFS transporter [Desulfohalovibrio reitneri]
MAESASGVSSKRQALVAARSVWVLLFGICLLMLGNGLQGSLLGVRATQEGFGGGLTGLVMSGFFAGFLLGSRWTPSAVRSVGHVRVFAALASVASVSILVHAVFVTPLVWGVMRFLTGLCLAGVYVVAESWLNDRAGNGSRGQLLAIYMVVTFLGMGGGQFLLNAADPGGAELFILASVLISLAVVPMLLTAAPVPESGAVDPVGLRRLFQVSPLGTVGTFVAGITNGTVFGMGAVYAHQAGLSVAEVALFMGVLIAGGAVFQYPVGMLSDIFDRRVVIMGVAFAAAGVAVAAQWAAGWSEGWLLALVGLFGGLALAVHSLCLAYTNDSLYSSEMVAASSGLVLVLGAGSILGPPVVGWLMDVLGPGGFFWWLALVHVAIGLYTLWRIVYHSGTPAEEQGPYVAMPAQASQFATEAAEEVYAEQEEERAE